jgi:hypothetical protein
MDCPHTEFGLQKAGDYPTEPSHSQSEKVKYLGLVLNLQILYGDRWLDLILAVLKFRVAGLDNYS